MSRKAKSVNENKKIREKMRYFEVRFSPILPGILTYGARFQPDRRRTRNSPALPCPPLWVRRLGEAGCPSTSSKDGWWLFDLVWLSEIWNFSNEQALGRPTQRPSLGPKSVTHRSTVRAIDIRPMIGRRIDQIGFSIGQFHWELPQLFFFALAMKLGSVRREKRLLPGHRPLPTSVSAEPSE